MSNNLDSMQPTMPRSQEAQELFALYTKDSKTDQTGIESSTAYEVFRNKTTAVEVIVKEVPQKRRKDSPHYQEIPIKRLQEENNNLKQELDKANSRLQTTRQGFSNLVYEMKKQLETASQKEMQSYTQNLALELENEKLRTLLECKSNLVAKIKKEFVSMKRILKFVIKSVSNAPQLPDNCTFNSDPEYDDFEKGLKREARVRFSNLFVGPGVTFDSTMSN